MGTRPCLKQTRSGSLQRVPAGVRIVLELLEDTRIEEGASGAKNSETRLFLLLLLVFGSEQTRALKRSLGICDVTRQVFYTVHAQHHLAKSIFPGGPFSEVRRVDGDDKHLRQLAGCATSPGPVGRGRQGGHVTVLFSNTHVHPIPACYTLNCRTPMTIPAIEIPPKARATGAVVCDRREREARMFIEV